MGKMKFPFPQRPGYLSARHADAGVFRQGDNRALSNGCVRLEENRASPRTMDIGQAIHVAPSKEPELRVKLPQGVPVYLTYLTAKPTSAGR